MSDFMKKGIVGSLKSALQKKEKNVDAETELKSSDFTRPTMTEDDFYSVSTTQVKDKLLNRTKAPSKSSADFNVSKHSYTVEGYRQMPVIGQMPVKKQYALMLTVGLVSLAVGVGSYIYGTTLGNKIENSKLSLSEIGVSVERISSSSKEILTGQTTGAGELKKNMVQLESQFKKLSQEMSGIGLGSEAEASLNSLDKKLSEYKKFGDLLGSSEEAIAAVQKMEAILGLGSNINVDLAQTGLAMFKTQQGASEFPTLIGLHQSMIDIGLNLKKAINGSDVESAAALSKVKESKEIYQALMYRMLSNIGGAISATPEIKAPFTDIAKNWVVMSNSLESIFKNIDSYRQIKNTYANADAVSFEKEFKTLSASFNKTVIGNQVYAIALFVLALIGLIASMASLVFIYLYEKDNRVFADKMEASKSQQSVLQLLDEMAPLQSGDLTKKTTVSTDITGSIADSINFTIDKLNSLVKNVKASASTMKEKTDDANNLSEKMLNLSNIQSSGIELSGDAILKMASSVNEISNKTSFGEKIASDAVMMANNGAVSVLSSIESMSAINTQMAESTRLARRLEESSKKISEIIELLADISEETTVLALNATVQASKSGEAGKGFRIVAESVQELANKATAATNTVGALINATQTDIQDVINAVQKTTQEAERGTALSEDAGRALKEITEVSAELAGVIHEISKETKVNAELATKLGSDIKEILSSTKESRESSLQTAAAIEEIAKLSGDLADSVREFKVENDEVGETNGFANNELEMMFGESDSAVSFDESSQDDYTNEIMKHFGVTQEDDGTILTEVTVGYDDFDLDTKEK